jgi:hypothetical protein
MNNLDVVNLLSEEWELCFARLKTNNKSAFYS